MLKLLDQFELLDRFEMCLTLSIYISYKGNNNLTKDHKIFQYLHMSILVCNASITAENWKMDNLYKVGNKVVNTSHTLLSSQYLPLL